MESLPRLPPRLAIANASTILPGSEPMKLLQPLALACTLIAFATIAATGQEPAKKDKVPDKVSYYKDVRPLFQLHCQGCHQPAKANGDYIMTDFAELFKKTEMGEIGVVAGQPEKSILYRQIVPQNGKPAAMPRGKDPLSPHSVGLIKRWIEQG